MGARKLYSELGAGLGKRGWDRDKERRRKAALRARRDSGTDELQFKKLQAVRSVNHDGKESAGDPALSTTPLDQLKAQGRIEPEMHEAGWIYAILHRHIYGRCTAHAHGYELVGKGSLVSQYIDDLETDQRREGTYRNADAALKKYDRWARKLIRDMLFRDWYPDNPHVRGIVRRGLEILAREFGLAKHRKV